MKRVTIIVLDSLGIGAMPDASNYGDRGANTLGHIAETVPSFLIPNLTAMGLGNIEGVTHLLQAKLPTASYGRLSEISRGKDTITGHWEIAGLETSIPFQTFPEGFPAEFISEFERRIGRGTLGNYAASGTDIIEKLGEEHRRTGKLIVYTSADSVFQIAADTGVIPLSELYNICLIAREMLVGDLQVGRVIARPFLVLDGKYKRTSDRRDYAVSPSGRTLLNFVQDSGQTVYAIGKISDIFNGNGITESVHTDSNMDGVDKTIVALKQDFSGLIFTNLVDFDSQFGHRRDPVGYARAIEEFDSRLPEILEALGPEDALILCADHGNDPVHTGWDHTREYVPMLIYGQRIRPGINLGTMKSFASISKSIASLLKTEKPEIGVDFTERLI